MYQKVKKIKIKHILSYVTFFLLFFTACKVDKKIEFYNPIGYDYNTVMEYFEENGFEYMRLITDINDICLMYYDNPYTGQSCFIFNDEYVCYKSMWTILNAEIDSVKYWLNKNCKKNSNDFLNWEDRKKDLTYSIEERGDGAYSLTCISTKLKSSNSEINKVVLNYYSARVFSPSTNEITEWSESYHRFVIPLAYNGEVNGNIIHFKPTGKLLTYKKTDDKCDDMNYDGIEGKIVYVLDDNEDDFLFYLANDLSFAAILDMRCKEDVWIEFSNINGQQNRFILVTKSF